MDKKIMKTRIICSKKDSDCHMARWKYGMCTHTNAACSDWNNMLNNGLIKIELFK